MKAFTDKEAVLLLKKVENHWLYHCLLTGLAN